ncbi:hypothetical protein EJ06DRAFT_551117 [Trichodelitschia bisporula]|uniref:Uncharacterized protein n=1 Tax=Trichodelitschia bisporula TaxID=703511 RepID=A0A6G1HMJ4_9PEZI|nr:hypothetical protein EJ06DRAFT_551117 [Trichodelitschia bisporula]
MHFSLLFLASTALASPLLNVHLERRDLATIQSAFTAVGNALTTFDNSVTPLSTSADVTNNLDTLVSQAGSIVDALNSGTTSVSGTSAVGLTDALSLVSAANNLVSITNTTVNDLITKHDIIDQAGATATVEQQLANEKAAAQSFIAAVVGKVPSAVQSIAAQQAQAVIDALNRGITAFGGSAKRAVGFGEGMGEGVGI